MGFLDKLFGRDKQQDEKATAPASKAEEQAAAAPSAAVAAAEPAPPEAAPADRLVARQDLASVRPGH